MGNVNWLTVGAPYDRARNDVVHAQFNTAYSFARAFADGKVDLRSYRKPAITDAGIAALPAITKSLTTRRSIPPPSNPRASNSR